MGFGKDGKGAMIREISEVNLLTLGDNSAIKSDALAITEDFRILKSEIFAHISGLTAGEGAGLLFGICSGELSAAEIAAAIDIDGPLDRNDRGSVETAERWVKLLSGIDLRLAETVGWFRNEVGGRKIVSTDRWTYSNPEGWDWFVYNMGGAGLTTGATFRVTATHYGVWVQ